MFELPIQPVSMLRLLSACCVAVLGVVGARADAEPLPRPAQLEPQVRFWARIYSEVDTGGGLIHDSSQMDVVYETIRIPEGISTRSQERHVERAKKAMSSCISTSPSGQTAPPRVPCRGTNRPY